MAFDGYQASMKPHKPFVVLCRKVVCRAYICAYRTRSRFACIHVYMNTYEYIDKCQHADIKCMHKERQRGEIRQRGRETAGREIDRETAKQPWRETDQ